MPDPEPLFPSALGANLLARRGDGGLTREVLAVRAGITTSTILRIESDPTYRPRLSTLDAIAEALGCQVADLLTTAAA